MRLAAPLLAVVVYACSGLLYAGVQMPPDAIGQRGTRVFAGDRGRVFRATIGALQALGYEIAFSDEAAGIIKTMPKNLHASTTQTLVYTRSYAVRLTPQPQSVVVEATPKVFQNGADISDKPVWDLGGSMGEYVLWDQLFGEIRSNLGR